MGDFTQTMGGPEDEGQKRGEGELRRGPGWAASMPPDGEDAAFGMSRVQGGAHQFLAHPWLKE